MAAVILGGAVLPSASARAAGPEGSVLELEGDDAGKAAALTKALRGAFSARGVGGGKEMSSIELKLTMGCDEPPAASCMASGGKTLGVRQLVYGTLSGKGPSYQLELTLVDVDAGTVSKNLKTSVDAAKLDAGAIDATAKDLVEQMIGPPPPEPEPEVAPPTPEPEPEYVTESKLVWGRHDAAKWKKAGLITSAVLTGVSLGTAAAMSVMIRPQGPVYNDLIDAAKGSLDDDKPANDVDPYTDENLCDIAKTPDADGNVKNAAVTKVCNRGQTMSTVAKIGYVGAGVFAASTVAFAVLLFVHREETTTMAKLRRRGASFGVAPLREGGVMVGGGMRF